MVSVADCLTLISRAVQSQNAAAELDGHETVSHSQRPTERPAPHALEHHETESMGVWLAFVLRVLRFFSK